MHINPHLPAPAAIHDPLFRPVARAARMAAARGAAHEPVDAVGGNRLRRELSRPETGGPADRANEAARGLARSPQGPAAAFGYGGASLFFAQQFAQEEAPHSGAGVVHKRAVSAYPSLHFDDDIVLPGQAVPLGWTDRPRLDLLV